MSEMVSMSYQCASADPSSGSFFERKYREAGDPWNFETSAYERGRYDATTSALEGRRYVRAFEPGCSIGVLTERLAGLCDQVDALEISPTAAETARQRCAALGNVNVRCASLLEELPSVQYDLIVLSEIGYYMTSEELRSCAERLVQTLSPAGVLLGVHWLGSSPDHRLSGDQVHDILAGLGGLIHDRGERHEGFRLDRWKKQ